jgi:tRNA A22 N-methylase
MTPLSARLDAILTLLAPCRLLADVGTDHGLLPIAAVTGRIAEHAIAADLRAAPLQSARRNLEAAGAAAHVTVVQGDGIQALAPYPVDAIVMAGVSGALMVRLCSAAPGVLATAEQLVVQPNSDAHIIRTWAREHGWHLTGERMVEERGRFFVVCALAKAAASASGATSAASDPAYAVAGWSEADLAVVGPLLLARKDDVARRWCHMQRDRIARLMAKRAPGLGAEHALWQAACDAME